VDTPPLSLTSYAMSKREVTWTVVAAVSLIGMFGIALPVSAYRGSLSATEIIEIAKILVSWPVAGFGIAWLISSRFHGAISGILGRGGWKAKAFGAEIETQVTQEQASLVATATATVAADPKIISGLPSTKLPANTSSLVRTTPADVATAPRGVGVPPELKQNPVYWRMAFLNLHLVPRTKVILDWIDRSGSVTKTDFDTLAANLGADAAERKAILDAVTTNGLVVDSEGKLHVTADGRLFAIAQRMSSSPVANAAPSNGWAKTRGGGGTLPRPNRAPAYSPSTVVGLIFFSTHQRAASRLKLRARKPPARTGQPNIV
jgi:hypothetical protein